MSKIDYSPKNREKLRRYMEQRKKTNGSQQLQPDKKEVQYFPLAQGNTYYSSAK